MLEKLYDSKKKVTVIFVIFIITILFLPFFLYVPYELTIKTPVREKSGRASEIIEFESIFEQKGGFERHYEIRDIQMEGDWNFSIEGMSFKVQSDSIVRIFSSINIPENAENGDVFYLQFRYFDTIREQQDMHSSIYSESFRVTVDNRDPPIVDINSGHGIYEASGSNLKYSPLLLIPLVIIIFCLYLLIMAQTDRKHRSTPGSEKVKTHEKP